MSSEPATQTSALPERHIPTLTLTAYNPAAPQGDQLKGKTTKSIYVLQELQEQV